MSNITKDDVIDMLYDYSCIKSRILNHHFKRVWVGIYVKQAIEKANRKLSY